MNDHCRACDCIRTASEMKLDDDFCLECLTISINATFDGFEDPEDD